MRSSVLVLLVLVLVFAALLDVDVTLFFAGAFFLAMIECWAVG
ncbi:MAG: hypothetical protein ACKPEY_05835 [Planctomycetota bacterium]